jgi:hypothetical protein
MSGKGSAPRPKSVDDDVFSANWALIFASKAADADKEPEPEPNLIVNEK